MTIFIAVGVVFVAVIALCVFLVVQTYNRLVLLKNRCNNGFAQIEVQLKRRYDLIPNLVESVKGYLTHERETLEGVIAARNQASVGLNAIAQNPGSAQALKSFAGSEGMLAGAMGRLNVVMEAYPELKANQNVAELTEELSHTENRIAFARQAYNDLVMTFNTYRQSFPTILFAGMFGYSQDREMLEFADAEEIQVAPQVSLVG